eukprot:g1759.t1
MMQDLAEAEQKADEDLAKALQAEEYETAIMDSNDLGLSVKGCDSDPSHRFCQTCVQNYVQTCLRNSDPFVCPAHGCSQPLPEASIPPRLRVPVRRHKLTVERRRDATSRWCPKCNTHNNIVPGTRKIVCKNEACGYAFCASCNQKYHWLGPCRRDKATRATLGWATWNHVKACPNCKTLIQKNNGCPHMKCSYCNHHFCWGCLGYLKWSSANQRTDGSKPPGRPCPEGIRCNEFTHHKIWGPNAAVRTVTKTLAVPVIIGAVATAAVPAAIGFGVYAARQHMRRKRIQRRHRARRQVLRPRQNANNNSNNNNRTRRLTMTAQGNHQRRNTTGIITTDEMRQIRDRVSRAESSLRELVQANRRVLEQRRAVAARRASATADADADADADAGGAAGGSGCGFVFESETGATSDNDTNDTNATKSAVQFEFEYEDDRSEQERMDDTERAKLRSRIDAMLALISDHHHSKGGVDGGYAARRRLQRLRQEGDVVKRIIRDIILDAQKHAIKGSVDADAIMKKICDVVGPTYGIGLAEVDDERHRRAVGALEQTLIAQEYARPTNRQDLAALLRASFPAGSVGLTSGLAELMPVKV